MKKCKCGNELNIEMIWALTDNRCPFCGSRIFAEDLIGLIIGKILRTKLSVVDENDREIKIKLVDLIIEILENDQIKGKITVVEEKIVEEVGKGDEGEELDEEDKAIIAAAEGFATPNLSNRIPVKKNSPKPIQRLS